MYLIPLRISVCVVIIEVANLKNNLTFEVHPVMLARDNPTKLSDLKYVRYLFWRYSASTSIWSHFITPSIVEVMIRDIHLKFGFHGWGITSETKSAFLTGEKLKSSWLFLGRSYARVSYNYVFMNSMRWFGASSSFHLIGAWSGSTRSIWLLIPQRVFIMRLRKEQVSRRGRTIFAVVGACDLVVMGDIRKQDQYYFLFSHLRCPANELLS